MLNFSVHPSSELSYPSLEDVDVLQDKKLVKFEIWFWN